MEEMNRKADAVFMTETLFDGQTEQGVELDHVLPDYYPEIFRILKCCLSPRVISAAVSGNKIMLDGVVLIKVLYLAENSTALHCVEQRYTWSKTVDIAGKAENLLAANPVSPWFPAPTTATAARSAAGGSISAERSVAALPSPALRNSPCPLCRTACRCSPGS